MSDQHFTQGDKPVNWAKKYKEAQPKPVTVSQQELVNTAFLRPEETLPLIIEPGQADVDLFDWVRSNKGANGVLESNLLKYGAILFRNFGLSTQGDFQNFLSSLSVPLMHYIEGATPRSELADKLYTSTEYPSEQSIALHNELNYVATWPMKIFFFCVRPAEQGGATPIADVRKVFNRIDSKVRDKFIEKGWMLVRGYGGRMGPTWQKSFRVNDKAALEDYCRKSHVELEWGDAGHLRTRQVRPVARLHPKTKEPVWFNHLVFWHVSSLEPNLREMLVNEFGFEGLPFNVYYGDGKPIDDEVITHLRQAYAQETTSFRWQAGDLLMIDNMLVAHGREPYVGNRSVLTAMGEPYSDMMTLTTD